MLGCLAPDGMLLRNLYPKYPINLWIVGGVVLAVLLLRGLHICRFFRELGRGIDIGE